MGCPLDGPNMLSNERRKLMGHEIEVQTFGNYSDGLAGEYKKMNIHKPNGFAKTK
jgi:hypothetical protein|tara:strand:+ start:206 stop:370 length:165 start_codon:yes stop_codon:yes gene_type:complete